MSYDLPPRFFRQCINPYKQDQDEDVSPHDLMAINGPVTCKLIVFDPVAKKMTARDLGQVFGRLVNPYAHLYAVKRAVPAASSLPVDLDDEPANVLSWSEGAAETVIFAPVARRAERSEHDGETGGKKSGSVCNTRTKYPTGFKTC
jgi:hypothetical protein